MRSRRDEMSASSSEPQLGEIYQEDFNMDRGDLQERAMHYLIVNILCRYL